MLLCFGTAGMLLVWQSTAVRSNVQAALLDLAAQSQLQVTAAASPAAPIAQRTKLVVSLSQRHVTLYKDDRAVATYDLAVAQVGWETPTGTFSVMHMEQNPTWIHPITGVKVPPGEDNPLGNAWIGFWTDGKAEIGFHGTNEEDLIGQAVSHGCLRMRNQDIAAVYSQVGQGTPVIVQP
jgi:lipoprotein-anchoring transpeptidase ErfK/SrfK